MLYSLDFESELTELKKMYRNVDDIEKILSEKRSVVRGFATKEGMNFNAIEECFQNYQKSLLIFMYTLSERMFKSFYYEHLKKDSKPCVERYVDSKIPESRFSPNVDFNIISSEIKRELFDEFVFVISPQCDYIKTYNEVVRCRHSYAHSNSYSPVYDKAKDYILVLEYLYNEIKTLDDYPKRKSYQNELSELRECYMEFYRIKNEKEIEKNKKTIQESIKEIKSKTKKFLKNYMGYIQNNEIFNPLLVKLKNVKLINLKKDSLSDQINIVRDCSIEFYQLINEKCCSQQKDS